MNHITDISAPVYLDGDDSNEIYDRYGDCIATVDNAVFAGQIVFAINYVATYGAGQKRMEHDALPTTPPPLAGEGVYRELVDAAQEALSLMSTKNRKARRLNAAVIQARAVMPSLAAQGNLWKEVVIDELVVAHCLKNEHETNPRKAIQDLITWNCQVALDPSVSSDAQALVDRGRDEAVRAPSQGTHRDFFHKHALGTKMAPSCFGCGAAWQTWDGATRYLELPNVFLCASCAEKVKSTSQVTAVTDDAVENALGAFYSGPGVYGSPRDPHKSEYRKRMRAALEAALASAAVWDERVSDALQICADAIDGFETSFALRGDRADVSDLCDARENARNVLTAIRTHQKVAAAGDEK